MEHLNPLRHFKLRSWGVEVISPF